PGGGCFESEVSIRTGDRRGEPASTVFRFAPGNDPRTRRGVASRQDQCTADDLGDWKEVEDVLFRRLPDRSVTSRVTVVGGDQERSCHLVCAWMQYTETSCRVRHVGHGHQALEEKQEVVGGEVTVVRRSRIRNGEDPRAGKRPLAVADDTG